jgi:hypothetical protein
VTLGPLPGISIATSAGLPPTATTDDGNHWVNGRCWLWCGRQLTRVTWIGPATTPGGLSTPLFACETCLTSLSDQVVEAVMRRDAVADEVHGYDTVGLPAAQREHPAHALPCGRHRLRDHWLF